MTHKLIAALLILLTAAQIAVRIAPPLVQKSSQNETKNKMIAAHIHDTLDSSIEKPLTISKAMAADSFLLQALKDEPHTAQHVMEQQMAEYLSTLKEKFNYIQTFVISEKSRRYYTPKGIEKVVNPQEESYDIWYQIFLDSGKEVDLDTDRDQLNDFRWTIFVNVRTTDEDGTTLGVCGVGVFMDRLQEQFMQTEKEYGVKINLIDTDGLVQVDTDTSNIANAYIAEALGDKAGSEAFTYKRRGRSGFRMTRYMKDLEWYLVVQSFSQKESLAGTWFSIITLYILLAAILVTVLIGNRKPNSHYIIKTDLTEDTLTGLPNRNYLKESYGEMGIFNTTRYKSLAMFDIDRFKAINETRDGDRILVTIAELAKKTVDNRGLVFRWSGDEFVLFLEMDGDEAEARLKNFCEEVQKQTDVTVSVGIVDVDLTESIKTNYHRAVQPCYAVKETGGNGVRRK